MTDSPRPEISARSGAAATPDGQARDYEYRVLTLSRHTSRAEARQLLTDHAEYGRWELAKVQLYMGGGRRVWLRRRIMRVARTG